MVLPRVVAYNEVSVDGRLGGFALDGVDYYRRGFAIPADAILMGSRTALAFGPAESAAERAADRAPIARVPLPDGFAELVSDPLPLLVVPDSAGAVHTWRHAAAQPWYRGLVSGVSATTPPEHLDYLDRRGVATITTGGARVDLREMLTVLADRHGVRAVRTDGGGALLGALLEAGLLSELVLLVRPVVSSEAAARPLVEVTGTGADGHPLRLAECTVLGDGSLWVRYEVVGGPFVD